MKSLIPLLASFGVAAICSAQGSSQPPRLLIFPFLGDSSEITGWVQSLGDDLANLAGAELEATARFTIVRIPAGNAASDLGTSKAETIKPDLILVGAVSRFGSPNPNATTVGQRTTTLEKGRKAEIAIMWQIIAPTEFISLKSGLSRGTESGRAFSLKDGYVPNITLSKSNPEFTNSALGKATFAAIANLVSNACLILGPPPAVAAAQKDPQWQSLGRSENIQSGSKVFSATATETTARNRDIQGKILGGTKQSVLIDIGRNKGVLVGDHYRVFEPSADGPNAPTPSRDSGEIEIREVQSDLSIGVYEGSGHPQPGWLIRLR